MSVFSPLFSVRESNCFSFSVFLSFPPFFPSSPGLKFRRHAIGGRTNERRRRRRRRNNGFDACSKSSSPFSTSLLLSPSVFSHTHITSSPLPHCVSSPLFLPPSESRGNICFPSRQRWEGARGRKTRKGKGKAKKWEERGTVVVEEFFSALSLCVFFSPRVILERCAFSKVVQLPPPVLTFCRRTRYSGGKPKKTPLSPPP